MSKFKDGDRVVVVKPGTVKGKALTKGLEGKIESASKDPKFAFARVVFPSLGPEELVVPYAWLGPKK